MIQALLYRKKSRFFFSDLVRRLHISGLSRQGIGALGRWHLLLVQLLKRLHEMERAWEGFACTRRVRERNTFFNVRKAGGGGGDTSPLGQRRKGNACPLSVENQNTSHIKAVRAD